MKLLLAIFMAVLTWGQTTSRESTKYDTVYACDGKMLRIDCQEGNVINLLRANYGRYSITVCNEAGNTDWSVNCNTHSSYNILQTRCSHKRNCSIPASTSLFGDPCPGTAKYLEAHYLCISANMTTSITKPNPPWLVTSQPSIWSTAKSITLHTEPILTTTTMAATTESVEKLPPKQPSTEAAQTPDEWPNTFLSSVQATPRELDLTTITEGTSTEAWIPSNDKTPLCKPVTMRNLSWNWTMGGDVSVQPCPGGATGLANWRCQTISPGLAIRFPDSPDLSECRSVWLTSLESRITDGDSLMKIASDLAQVTESKNLFGGDMWTTTKIIKDIAAKMSKDILTFPDSRQREAIVFDLLQSVSRVGSNLLDASAQLSWKDLSIKEQMRVATALLVGLEEHSFLMAETVGREKTVTHCADNILLSVQVIEARNVANQMFPTPETTDNCTLKVNNWIQLQKSSLVENSENGLVRLVYIYFNTLQNVVKVSSGNKEEKKINSRVLSASLGKGRHIQLTEPVLLCLEHIETENVSNPSCVFWDYTQSNWSEEGCVLLSTNDTHSICRCNHLTSFALMVDVRPIGHKGGNYSAAMIFFSMVAALALLVAGAFFGVRYARENWGQKDFDDDEDYEDGCSFGCCRKMQPAEKAAPANCCKEPRPSLYVGNTPLPNIVEENILQTTLQRSHSSNTIPSAFATMRGDYEVESHYAPHPHVKMNHYPTYGNHRNGGAGSMRKIKEARRLEHLEHTLQHRNRKLSQQIAARGHTYSEIMAANRMGMGVGDPVYEEIEREKAVGHCSQVSDVSASDEDKRTSDTSRQSSRSYGDHRPLIPYNAAAHDRNFQAALDAAYRQQLLEHSARTVSVLDGQTVVCHLQPNEGKYGHGKVSHPQQHY